MSILTDAFDEIVNAVEFAIQAIDQNDPALSKLHLESAVERSIEILTAGGK